LDVIVTTADFEGGLHVAALSASPGDSSIAATSSSARCSTGGLREGAQVVPSGPRPLAYVSLGTIFNRDVDR